MGKKGNHKSLYLVLLALLKIFINVFRYEWLRKLNKILTGLTSSKSCADYQKQQQVRKMKNGNHYLSKYHRVYLEDLFSINSYVLKFLG